MSTSTIYDVRVRYKMDRSAKTDMGGLANEADRAARSTGLLGRALGLIGAGVALRAGKSALIDFNAKVEQQTLSLATIIQMNLGGSFDRASERAFAMHTVYQDMAKKSVGTTQDFIEMNNQIAASVFRAGLGVKELQGLTRGGVIAATVLGERADIAALDIKQMLSGDVTTRDRVAQQLLASQGLSHTKFNAMDQAKRNQVIVKALNQPAIQNAAKAMESSFSGVTSTLMDNIQILAGKVGLPLFKAITDEVKQWNAWIEKNPQKIAEFAKKFSAGLMEGLRVAKSVVKALVDNKDLILAFAAMKGLGLAGGFLGGLKGDMFAFSTALKEGETKIGGFASALGRAAGALGLVYLAAQAFANWVDQRQTARIDRTTGFEFSREATRRMEAAETAKGALGLLDRVGINTGTLRKRIDGAGGFDATTLINKARDLGALDKSGTKFDAAKARAGLEQGGQMMADADVKNIQGMIDRRDGNWQKLQTAIDRHNEAVRMLAGMEMAVSSRLLKGFGVAEVLKDAVKEKEESKPPKVAGGMTVNIRQVVSDDPDRFVVGLRRLTRRALRSPTSAATAVSGAF